MSDPRTLHPRTIVGDTIPIVFEFDESVDGATFSFTHSLWGAISVTGVGQRASVPVTEVRAAAAAATYTYTLVINDGVEGQEQTVARGNHYHLDRAYAP